MSRLTLALTLLAACDAGVTTETNTVTDEGEACLDNGVVTVDFRQCLSSSCDRLISAECTATLVDGVLEVTAEAVIESQVGVACTEDCRMVTVDCDAPLIEDPDTVAMSYAGTTTPLDDATCEDIPF